MVKTNTILIVDPNTDAVKEYASLLTDGGYDVDTCKRFVEAVEIIEQDRFNCVIMDVELEDVKGYNAVDIIKTIDPQIEVILTARENTKELEAKVRAQDIFYYYIKSFKGEELLMAVNNLFRKGIKEVKMKGNNQHSKILVIDDDHDFLNSMKIILESASYKFVSADGPKEGMEMVKSEKPDLILLDIMMDSLFDGFSMCHTLKTSKEYRAYHDIPIIFVSAVKEKAGSRFSFDPGDCGQVGPNDYIDKPIEPDDLLARIEKFLER